MPRQQYECSKGHLSEHITRSVNDEKPETIKCQTCTKRAKWIPSAPMEMLMDRATNRKHSQPDEWDPATNPKLRPKRILEPGE